MRKTVAVLSAGLLGFGCLAEASETDTGKQVFVQEAQPSCTICHALSDAGSEGAIGPDLDELKPTRDQVINAVTSGVGVMPAFADSLSSEQIQAVADYIVKVTASPE
ncbi:sulfide dehydrogenase [Marinobacter vulgaris]|uniref:Sulfide dehydrogenase n=1 Tax=Marinobacter vulgaris TaxID=1928331 RepID=A0A2V3ZPW2_9GAMM|nr:cytochrome c [Marinobacter vulgaris]PXX93555.1 sulfide dehydrogenase [Marinobacter vulgaris]TSJ72429.1 cytochrome c [Marinobacter vulgaris]